MRINILGSNISVYDLTETLQELNKLAREGGKHYICVSNVHTTVMGLRDPSYRKITNTATVATPDGVPLIWASRILKGPRIHGRASGPDILAAILHDTESRNLRHYFYGSTPKVLAALEPKLRELAPTANLAGFYSPPLRPIPSPDAALNEAEIEECELINKAKTDIIWVGLGAPKQEIWMYRTRKHLTAPILIGVGAAFDFLAGHKARAPRWMRKSGLEWLHRLSQEPSRLASRYLFTNPIFVANVIKQAILGWRD